MVWEVMWICWIYGVVVFCEVIIFKKEEFVFLHVLFTKYTINNKKV